MKMKKLAVIPFICIIMLTGCSKIKEEVGIQEVTEKEKVETTTDDSKKQGLMNDVKDTIEEIKTKAKEITNKEELEPIKSGITNSVDTVKEAINEINLDDVKSSVIDLTDKALAGLKGAVNKIAENESYKEIKTEIMNVIN